MVAALAGRAHAQGGEPPPMFTEAEGITLEGLHSVQAERFDKLKEKPTTAGLQLVRLPENLVGQRLLALTLTDEGRIAPGRNAGGKTILLARRDRIDVPSEYEYAWVGTVYAPSEGNHAVGDVTLVHREGGGVTGTLRIGTELFEVRALSNGLHALVDVDESAYPEGDSPVHDGGAPGAEYSGAGASVMTEEEGESLSSSSVEAPTIQKSAPTEAVSMVDAQRSGDRCSPNHTRALVVHTATAAQGRDIEGIAGLALQETNEAYVNSEVNNLRLRRTPYPTQQVSFEEGSSTAADIGRLRNDAEIQSLREEYQADVVVLLTDGAYGSGGRAYDILVDEDDAYAIVQVDYATGHYTFGHEVGHLQGAQHHPDDPVDPNKGFPYGYGHRFTDPDPYATVMAYTRTLNGVYARVKHFSNPGVTFNLYPTGTSTRDNARVLRNTAETVSDFRNPNELRVAPSIDYSGGPYEGNYTFTTDHCGGEGTISYEWQLSYGDPYSFYTVSGANSQSLTYYLSEGDWFVKSIVRSSAGQEEASLVEHIYVVGDCGQIICESGEMAAVEESGEVTEAIAARGTASFPDEYALHGVFPNPFERSAEVAFDLPEPVEVTLVVYDVLGREVMRLAEGRLEAGRYRRALDGQGLPSGTYVVRFRAGEYVQTVQVSRMR